MFGIGLVLTITAVGASPASAATDPGEIAFAFCSNCHSVDPKETDMPGPNLSGVLCRAPASLAGFEYTPGMKAFAQTHKLWTPALIDQYLTNPQGMVADSPMELPPQVVKSPDVRRDVIGYLKQHSGDAATACPK